MIEKVVIENCESHVRTAVKFERVTTIVGPNDVGKSAFLRALWWLVANDPPGTEHIRHGADFAAVHLKVDGRWVQRRRSEKENSYTFAEETYTSLRAPSVPEAIESFLRLGEVNFQWQMDAPFWLSDTPGALSRKLNAVVDLVTIDETIDVARSEVGKAKTKVALAEGRVAGLKAKLAELAWVPEAERLLAELDAAALASSKAESDFLALEELCHQIEGDQARADWLDELDRAAEGAFSAAVAAREATAHFRRLEKDVRDLEAAQKSLPPEIDGGWEELRELRRRGDEAAEYWRLLDVEIRLQEESEDKKCRLDEELATLEGRLASETAGRCPACGQATRPSQFLPPTSTSPTPSPRLEQKAARAGFDRKPRS